MKLLIQPNKWSCLPTSLAMLLDETVDDIIKEIGHDGSEIINNLNEPHNRKGFHIQELVKICLNRNIALIHFDTMVCKHNGDYHTSYDDSEYVNELMKDNSGIILGVINNRDHAVAWNSKEGCIYDPNGTIYAKGFISSIESFLMMKDLK